MERQINLVETELEVHDGKAQIIKSFEYETDNLSISFYPDTNTILIFNHDIDLLADWEIDIKFLQQEPIKDPVKIHCNIEFKAIGELLFKKGLWVVNFYDEDLKPADGLDVLTAFENAVLNNYFEFLP